MYSYEDRIRGVELYIKLGKRVGATIRQLGYPTENSLKSWHEQYVRDLDVPRGYVRAKPKYSQAQRQLAVQHYLDQGRCIAWTIKALGYPSRDLLRAWIRESHPELHRRLVGRSDSHARSPAMGVRWISWTTDGGSSDIPTKTEFERLGCTSSLASALGRRFASWGCGGFFWTNNPGNSSPLIYSFSVQRRERR